MDVQESMKEWKDVMETVKSISQEEHEEVGESKETKGEPMDLAEDVAEREIVCGQKVIGSITEVVKQRNLYGIRKRKSFERITPVKRVRGNKGKNILTVKKFTRGANKFCGRNQLGEDDRNYLELFLKEHNMSSLVWIHPNHRTW